MLPKRPQCQTLEPDTLAVCSLIAVFPALKQPRVLLLAPLIRVDPAHDAGFQAFSDQLSAVSAGKVKGVSDGEPPLC